MSKVYFTAVSESDSEEKVSAGLGRLIEKSDAFGFVGAKDRVALKIHFGEEGNTGYVRPSYVRVITEAIRRKSGNLFISDTNTLYSGRRMNSREHAKLAHEHGFTPENIGCPLYIPDDKKKENVTTVKIDGKFVKTAKVASCYKDADVIVDISHFKGHMMTGFGGALKNLGMGCATREGKLEQHSDVSPYVMAKKCVGCEACVSVCPAEAILIKGGKAAIDNKMCIGCASCIAACSYNAIDVDWESGGEIIQEKMVEYAKAVLQGKENRALFINFANKITKECDCLAQDDPRIAPDVGIFLSRDPVSVDKACLDMVIKAAKQDVFKKAHPARDGMKQLNHARDLGLGSLEYELITV